MATWAGVRSESQEPPAPVHDQGRAGLGRRWVCHPQRLPQEPLARLAKARPSPGAGHGGQSQAGQGDCTDTQNQKVGRGTTAPQALAGEVGRRRGAAQHPPPPPPVRWLQRHAAPAAPGLPEPSQRGRGRGHRAWRWKPMMSAPHHPGSGGHALSCTEHSRGHQEVTLGTLSGLTPSAHRANRPPWSSEWGWGGRLSTRVMSLSVDSCSQSPWP